MLVEHEEQSAIDRRHGEEDPDPPKAPIVQRSGEHRFHVCDDVVYWECHGAMEIQDIQAMFEQRVAVQRQLGRVFLVFDAHALDGIPSESRRYAIDFKPEQAFHGAVVIVRAGLLARTAVALITTAAKLLGRTEQALISFADNEAEAQTQLARHRLALGLGPSTT